MPFENSLDYLQLCLDFADTVTLDIVKQHLKYFSQADPSL